MPAPLVVTIPHRLGRDQARRRVDRGLDHVRARIASFVSGLEYEWSDYRLDWSLRAIGQRITGRTIVEDEQVLIEIDLPLLLRMLSGPNIDAVRKEGVSLLAKPPGA